MITATCLGSRVKSKLFEQARLFWRYRAERTGCGDMQRFVSIAMDTVSMQAFYGNFFTTQS